MKKLQTVNIKYGYDVINDVNYISRTKYTENFHWLLALLYGPYIRAPGTHHPYIRAVYTGAKNAPVYTGRMYGPYIRVTCTLSRIIVYKAVQLL